MRPVSPDVVGRPHVDVHLAVTPGTNRYDPRAVLIGAAVSRWSVVCILHGVRGGDALFNHDTEPGVTE